MSDDDYIDEAEEAWKNGGIPFMLDHIGLDGAANEVNALIGERDRYRSALEEIAHAQPAVIEWFRSNGVVFDGPLGTGPKNWENVAFSIYNDLCEVDSIARNALKEGVQA